MLKSIDRSIWVAEQPLKYWGLPVGTRMTDTAFNFQDNSPLVTQLATRILGCYGNLRPSLLEKIATKDKDKVKHSLPKILAWDFQRVIVAHGNIVETNAKQQFQAGYNWFLNENSLS